MPGFIDSFLSAIAPHLRTGGLGLVIFLFLSMFLHGLGNQKLNRTLGIAIIIGAIVFAKLMILTYIFGHANEVAGTYTENGKLILYGIIWPIVAVVAGLSIADRGPKNAPERKNEGN
jgi:hypothetical protein